MHMHDRYVFHQTLVLIGVGIRICQKISKIVNVVQSYVGYGMEGPCVWRNSMSTYFKIQVAEGILSHPR